MMLGTSLTSFVDPAIVTAAIGMLFVIAYFTGRRESDLKDFFLGNRRVPAFVVCLSLVATEVSAVTITNVPGTGATENLRYLQFFIGSAASKLFVAFLFLPVFYKSECTSIYEFLKVRFGPPTQYAGSIFFFVTRLLGSGVRLYAACAAIALVMGWSLAQSLLLFSIVSIVFIAFGGVKAVVWNGAYQAVVFYAAGLGVLVYSLTQIQGGLATVWQVAGSAGRLDIFNWSLDLNDASTFWAGAANAFFIGLAVFGTDQEFVQRMLTARTRSASQKAMIWTIVAALPVTFMYLAIGTLIYVFVNQHPGSLSLAVAKDVFPGFINGFLPVGLKGLVIAAILLASIDSPLSSLSSSFVMDIYRPLIHRDGSQRHYLWVSRLGIVGFGVALALIAAACQPVKNVLWFAFEIISITGGSMLGIFLLGLLTRRNGSNVGNVLAMVVNSLLMAGMLLLSKFDLAVPSLWGLTKPFVVRVPIAWCWSIVIGTGLTFAMAAIFGRIWPDANPPAPQPLRPRQVELPAGAAK